MKFAFIGGCSTLIHAVAKLSATIDPQGRRGATSADGEPFRIAIAIPVHNEILLIEQTIRSVLATRIEAKDVYLLLNGCTDGTEETVRAVNSTLRQPVNCIIAPVTGKANTIRWAIHGARLFEEYMFVLLSDADTQPDQGLLDSVGNTLQTDASIDIICGHPRSIRHNWLTAYRALLYFMADWIDRPGQGRLGTLIVVPGCVAVYRTSVLKKLDWTGDTPTEDFDATIQAAALGARIVYETNAIVHTIDPATVKDYIGQVGSRWFRGAWMVLGKHGVLWKGLSSKVNWECRMLFIEPFLYAAGVAWFLIAHSTRLSPILASFWAIIILISGIAAVHERRFDVLLYSPLFPLLRILDIALFLGTMPFIMKRRDVEPRWYKPRRYEVRKEKRSSNHAP